MDPQRFFQCLPDGAPRVQGGIGILKMNCMRGRSLRMAARDAWRRSMPSKVTAGMVQPGAGSPATPSTCRSRLADQANAVAGRHIEGNVGDGADNLPSPAQQAALLEVLGELADHQDAVLFAGHATPFWARTRQRRRRWRRRPRLQIRMAVALRLAQNSAAAQPGIVIAGT